MKTIVNTFLCFLLLASSAFALPYLQLDIKDTDGVIYNKKTQTIVSQSDDFELLALVNTTSDSDKHEPGDWFIISIALTPYQESDDSSLGSFVFNGENYNVKSDMTLGEPRIGNISKHTYYKEFKFNFNDDFTNTIAAYNTATQESAKQAPLNYAAFDVDVSSLVSGYQLHFDFYTADNTEAFTIDKKAPFSHDAESGGNRTPPPPTDNPVPEPATILLLGFGLIGLARIGRKKLL